MGVASYVLKADRAERHLVELGAAIAAYAETHPYEVHRKIEGKKKRPVHRLVFTAQPDPVIGIIAADFIYNMRSGLDHLMAALVPAGRRDSTMFPIFWQGVWEDPQPGDGEQRRKDRSRWQSSVKKAAAGAVEIIKQLQPTEDAADSQTFSPLVALNRLSNQDRHSGIPTYGHALHRPSGHYRLPGSPDIKVTSEQFTDDEGLIDGGELVVPPNATEVVVEGDAIVTVKVRHPDGFLRLPELFEHMLKSYRDTIEVLAPFAKVQ